MSARSLPPTNPISHFFSVGRKWGLRILEEVTFKTSQIFPDFPEGGRRGRRACIKTASWRARLGYGMHRYEGLLTFPYSRILTRLGSCLSDGDTVLLLHPPFLYCTCLKDRGSSYVSLTPYNLTCSDLRTVMVSAASVFSVFLLSLIPYKEGLWHRYVL